MDQMEMVNSGGLALATDRALLGRGAAFGVFDHRFDEVDRLVGPEVGADLFGEALGPGEDAPTSRIA